MNHPDQTPNACPACGRPISREEAARVLGRAAAGVPKRITAKERRRRTAQLDAHRYRGGRKRKE